MTPKDEGGAEERGDGDPVKAEEREVDGRQRCGDERGKRRVARKERDRDPGRCGQQSDRPRKRDQDAEVGRDALAALEAEPHRIDVAHERGASGGNARDRPGGGAGDDNGEDALERIEKKRRRGETLAAGAQDIGRTDISGADVADVAEAAARL